MKIEITIKADNDEIIAKREALTFESAGEDLGKLERFVENKVKEGFCTKCNDYCYGDNRCE